MEVSGDSITTYVTSERYRSKKPATATIIAIAAGYDHGLSLDDDGRISGWGNDSEGQVSGAPQVGGFQAISAGQYYSLALDGEGRIHAWGYDGEGQVSDVPAGTGFVAISAGTSHALAINQFGRIIGWGRDGVGQVSDRPFGNNFIAVAAGFDFSVALDAQGEIYAWGHNGWGQITSRPLGVGYTTIVCGREHALALDATGAIHAWGRDNANQVSFAPFGSGYSDISSHYDFCLALNSEGQVFAWGADNRGQVSGVPSEAGFASVAAGQNFGMAMDDNGFVQAWGDNSYDQVTDAPWETIWFESMTPIGEVVGSYFDDLYNRLHVTPKPLTLGEVCSTITSPLTLWNANFTPVEVTDCTIVDAQGVALDGFAPTVLDPLVGLTTVDVVTDIVGPPDVYAEVQFTFDVEPDNSIKVTGSRKRLWDFAPNWRNPFEITYEFRTEVFTSRSRKEQRRSLRQEARRSVGFRSLVNDARFAALSGALASWQTNAFVLPEFVRPVRLASRLEKGGTSVSLDVVPEWMDEGVSVAVTDGVDSEIFAVSHFVGNIVTFTKKSDHLWHSGAKVTPIMIGRVASTLRANQYTDALSNVAFDFEVTPGPQNRRVIPPAAQIFDGYELFTKTPNWQRTPTLSFGSSLEKIDYGMGRVGYFTPSEFNPLHSQLTFVGRSLDELDSLVDLFMRMKGQRGEFYAPTFTNDIVPKDELIAASSNIRIEGEDFYLNYASDPVREAIYLRTVGGQILIRRVVDVYRVNDFRGRDSILQVDEPWPHDIGPEQISVLSWLPRWRFTTDALTVQYITDEVGQIVMNMRVVEK